MPTTRKRGTSLSHINVIAILPCNFAMILKWKQLQPAEPELYFYRTAAGLEVDFLLASERGIIPIEAKSSERVTAADGRSVETFMAEHRDAAKVGLVVYPGDEVIELRRNVWGVPDWYL